MQYGEMIDGGYNPLKEDVYTYFVEYFRNPELVKIKNVNQLSVYACKMYAIMGIDKRYIMAVLPKDNSKIGTKKHLSELNWESLQTRTLTDNYDLPPYVYNSRLYKPLNKMCHLKSKQPDSYIFDCDEYPLRLSLLRTKEKSNLEYGQQITLISALETFQCLISWNSR